ncbi:MAG: hypothetical protein AB7F78_19925 [Hyphomicrobiaceae bacterium]
MLTESELVIQARTLAKEGQRLPVLLLLAHVEQPAKTRTITERAAEIGFRQMKDWNVSAVLASADSANLVTKRADGWLLLEPGIEVLKKCGIDLALKRQIRPSDSVVPRELVAKTRGYIEKVVAQINGSYDHQLYDCCAVMCRRLIETLIIEVYEADGRASEIKGSDGHFHMLNGLLRVLLNDAQINLGRNSRRGLTELKELGDKSAHSRMFNARQSDIDHLKADLRTAVEELLHRARFV